MHLSALLLAAATQAASSADGRLRLDEVEPPTLGCSTNSSSPEWKLYIDDGWKASSLKQKVEGFGATVADVTVDAYNTLPPASRDRLLNLLMTPEGANFNLMRHTIGSSDLSAAPAYTYADNGGKPDPNLDSFDLGDRGRRMAAMLREMKMIQPSMVLVGTPWAPPAWMQRQENVSSVLKNTLDPQYYTQFANYLIKYLTAYKDEGVEVNAITIQNEPVRNEPGTPSLFISGDEASGLIRNSIAPAIKNSGLGTPIWIGDQNTDQIQYVQSVLIGNGAAPLAAVAWHCYAPGENWTALSAFKKTVPGILQYMTECWTSELYTKWNQASWFTIGPLRNWASGSIARVLGTFSAKGPRLGLKGSCEACTGLFTVDAERGTFELRPDFFMMAQYSRFLPRGARILRDSGSAMDGDDESGIESVAALLSDRRRVVVVENRFSQRMKVVLTTRSGQVWTGHVTPRSVTTWILPSRQERGSAAVVQPPFALLFALVISVAVCLV